MPDSTRILLPAQFVLIDGTKKRLTFRIRRIPMRTARWLVMCGSILTSIILGLSVGDSAEPKQLGPGPKKWEGLVDKAIDYLKTSQAEDGSWSGKRSPGVTGIVLTGILRTGRVKAEDPVAAKALSYV